MACTAAEGRKEVRSANGDVKRGEARGDRKRSLDCKQKDVTADFHEQTDAVSDELSGPWDKKPPYPELCHEI